MPSPLALFGSYLVVFFISIYLMIYIPNKKKQKKKQEIHNKMKIGDEVVTIGGIVGTIVEKDNAYVTLMIDKEKKTTVKIIIYAVGQIIEED